MYRRYYRYSAMPEMSAKLVQDNEQYEFENAPEKDISQPPVSVQRTERQQPEPVMQSSKSRDAVFETTPVEITKNNNKSAGFDLSKFIAGLDFDIILIGAIILLLLLDGTDDYWLLIALGFILLSEFIDT